MVRHDQMRLKPSVDCVVREIGGETVLLHLSKGTYFGLNETGTQIWRLLAGGASAGEIVDAFAQEHEIPRKQLESDIRAFLDDLLENGILLGGDGSAEDPGRSPA